MPRAAKRQGAKRTRDPASSRGTQEEERDTKRSRNDDVITTTSTSTSTSPPGTQKGPSDTPPQDLTLDINLEVCTEDIPPTAKTDTASPQQDTPPHCTVDAIPKGEATTPTTASPKKGSASVEPAEEVPDSLDEILMQVDPPCHVYVQTTSNEPSCTALMEALHARMGCIEEHTKGLAEAVSSSAASFRALQATCAAQHTALLQERDTQQQRQDLLTAQTQALLAQQGCVIQGSLNTMTLRAGESQRGQAAIEARLRGIEEAVATMSLGNAGGRGGEGGVPPQPHGSMQGHQGPPGHQGGQIQAQGGMQMQGQTRRVPVPFQPDRASTPPARVPASSARCTPARPGLDFYSTGSMSGGGMPPIPQRGAVTPR